MGKKEITRVKASLADRLAFDDSMWDEFELIDFCSDNHSYNEKVQKAKLVTKIRNQEWVQGILYKICCLANNREYIGQTTCIRIPALPKSLSRVIGHLNALRNNSHDKASMQKDWNKYGKENFEVSIVEIYDERMVSDIRDFKAFLNKREVELIFERNSVYNSEIQNARIHTTAVNAGFSSKAELIESISLGETSTISLFDEWVYIEDHHPYCSSTRHLMPGLKIRAR
ncbi:hypothetical protein [uncultured Nostoc sp.]|uniref:hypothetical protein n=1 Tax=uncultured Nostoc sp. TaxID=340711 RepID=UPI0035CBC838